MSNTAYDVQVYDYNYLSENDKESVDAMDGMKEEILNNDVIADFIESKSFSGGMLQSIYKEALTDFVNYLRERAEYSKVDYIIAMIDKYTDEEFAEYSNGAKKPIPFEQQNEIINAVKTTEGKER